MTIIKKLAAAMEVVEALELVQSGKVRVSSSGTPHLVGSENGTSFSVGYFRRSDSYRVFFPYPASNQMRIDFKSPEEVSRFLKCLPVPKAPKR